MKTPKILVPILLIVLLAACVPAVDTQSAIETGIAQTQQISQLETAAADNGGQQNQDQSQVGAAPDEEQVQFSVQNNNSLSICAVWVSYRDTPDFPTSELLKGNLIQPGDIYWFAAIPGTYNIGIYDCNQEFLDGVDGVIINAENFNFTSPWTGENGTQNN